MLDISFSMVLFESRNVSSIGWIPGQWNKYEKNLGKAEKLQNANSLQLAKVIKIKSKKNKTGLICFMLILVE